MATKVVDIEPFGAVAFLRRRGQKNISLRVDANGCVKVSYPWFTSQAMAIAFLNKKSNWVQEQQEKLLHVWKSGQSITPALKMFIAQDNIKRPIKRLSSNGITFIFPYGFPRSSQQKYIERTVIDEQKTYVEKTYLPILSRLARENGFEYKSARVKALKSRWGSCSSHKDIVLNAYLSQLSFDLVEYVLLHELAHTRHLNHSSVFWECMSSTLPEYKSLRKKLRSFQPAPRPYCVP